MNVFIFYGAFGHPNENWFPWLKEALIQEQVDCIIPTFPTPENQNLENWLSLFFSDYYALLNEESILIGHSLGAVFLLRLAEKLNIKIKHAILVGAFLGKVDNKKFDTLNESFFSTPFDWNKINKTLEKISYYFSDSDPYVSVEQRAEIIKQLNPSQYNIIGAGHFNEAAHYLQFPQLLSHLKRI